MADIGAKISLDGEKQFRDELKQLTQQGKTLTAQMGALASSFDSADNKEEALAKVSGNLTAQIKNQKAIVDKLKAAVNKSTKEKGADATQTLKLKEQLAKAETQLNKLNKTTAESAVGMKDLAKSEEEAGKNAEKSAKPLGVMGVALGNLAADAIKAGIKAIADGVKNIASYFVSATTGASKFADEILTLASETNMSTNALQEYKYMSSLVDVELSTITGSVSKLTKSMDSAKSGTGSAAEAFKKLGVSVKNEDGSLRSTNAVFDEAITALGQIKNETERDALAVQIFGKSAKELNPLIKAGGEKLAEFRKEAHDVGYVLDGGTLNALSDVQDGFDRISLAGEAMKNQLGANIGKGILPYLNQFVAAVQKLSGGGSLEDFIDEVSVIIENLADRLIESLPRIFEIGGKILQKLIQGINKALPKLVPFVKTLVQNIVKFVLTNLPAIVQTGIEIIIALIQGIAEMLPELIPMAVQCIVTIVQALADNVGLLVASALTLIQGLVQGLTSPETISTLIGAIPTIIGGLVQGILDNLPTIIAAGINITGSLILGIIEAIPDIIAALPQIFNEVGSALVGFDWGSLGSNIMGQIGDNIKQAASDIWNAVSYAFKAAIEWIKNVAVKAYYWGKDIIKGLVDGIKSAASWLWEECKAIGRGIKDFLGFSVPKKGPLHYYESWMPDFMMGLAKGIDENAWRVQDAISDVSVGMSLAGQTTNVDVGGIGINVYAAPNQDANAIARQVMAVMQNEYLAKKAVFA